MGAVWLLARGELRRRWGSLLGVGALVAIVSTVVLAALVGAQRTSTSVERFRERAHASDGSFQSDLPERADAMLAAAADTPEVETAGLRILVNVFPADGTTPDLAVMSDPEGVYGSDLDRPLVLEGRMPGADAPDEILLNELAARVTGLGVGDVIEANTWSQQDLEALFDNKNFPGFNGPTLDLRVVGVGRTPEELTGDVRRTAPFAIGSPAFIGQHPDIGAWPPAVVVRTYDGGADLEAVTTAITEIRDLTDSNEGPGAFYPDATTAEEVYLDTSRNTVNSLAVGLLAFAAASALAGALAVGQAVQRQLAGSSTPSAALRSLGLTRAQIASAHTLPILGTGVAGVVVGAGVAVAVSPLLPRGLAERAEVDPGVWVAPGILVAGASVILVLLGAWSFTAARRRVTDTSSAMARRPSPLARLATRLNAGPPVATGLRLASDRGRGSGAVPVRSALAGLTIAVAGTLAAGVVAASFHDLESTPRRWGWAWSSMPDYFGDDDIATLEAQLLEDDRVEAVADLGVDSLVIEGRGVTTYALEPLRGSMTMTSLEGRLPAGPSEIAMGNATMDELDVSIGDSVEASLPGGGSAALVVVGSVVIPPTDEYALDVGAVLTPDGLKAAGTGDLLESVVLRYPPGVDESELEAALAADYGFDFNLFTHPNPPGPVRNLVESRNMAASLAGFFAVLAAVGLLHALVVSTRRRRGDLAVLRALGFSRAQVRGSISTAALTLAIAGVVIGIPVGVVVGRVVWRALVVDLGAVADPATPWLLLVAVAPATVGIALLASWWPGRSAVRVRPSHQLRAE